MKNSFILIDYNGQKINSRRNTMAGFAAWEFIHSYLNSDLMEITDLGLIDENTLVIAEESVITQQLLRTLPSFKRIIFINFESPLYLKKLELSVPNIRIDFNNMFFPLFTEKTIRSLYAENNLLRNKNNNAIALVAANKSRGKISKFNGNLSNIKAILRNKTWQWKLETNLLKREEFIIKCSKMSEVHLFGASWQFFLPLYFKRNILWLGVTENKIETLSDYRFGIGFENYEELNYHTEKVPELILAGCCPVVPNQFENHVHVPYGLYCTENEYINDRNMCWQRFSNAYYQEDTIEYLCRFAIENIGKIFDRTGALDSV